MHTGEVATDLAWAFVHTIWCNFDPRGCVVRCGWHDGERLAFVS